MDWQKTYGDSAIDQAYSIQQTTDSGYIVAGTTYSFGAGGADAWIIKINSAGTIQWQKTFRGTGTDRAYDIRQTTDGGFIIAGSTDSFGNGATDAWIIKLDSSGTLKWGKAIGGSAGENARTILEAYDGGYIIGGISNYGATMLKIDSSGNIQWQKAYSVQNYQTNFCSIDITIDNNYVAAGDAQEPGNNAIFVAKLLSDGTITTNCPLENNITLSEESSTLSAYNTNIIPVNISVSVINTNCTITNANFDTVSLCPTHSAGSINNTLRISKSNGNPVLSWQEPNQACVFTSYGVYRGSLPFSDYDHEYLTCSMPSLGYTDYSATGNYYLVVPNNVESEGSYGTSYPGNNERPSSSNACKPQNINPCN